MFQLGELREHFIRRQAIQVVIAQHLETKEDDAIAVLEFWHLLYPLAGTEVVVEYRDHVLHDVHCVVWVRGERLRAAGDFEVFCVRVFVDWYVHCGPWCASRGGGVEESGKRGHV